jgi:hypothetical protein
MAFSSRHMRIAVLIMVAVSSAAWPPSISPAFGSLRTMIP